MRNYNGSREPGTGSVILVSGGLDSAVLLGLALEKREPVWPLYVRQGFVWEEEEVAAIQQYFDALRERDSGGNIEPLTFSALTAPSSFPIRWAVDPDHAPPAVGTPDEDVYIPGRNLALLTAGSILGITAGVGRIQLGILECNPFPDATPAFFRAFCEAAAEAMQWKFAVETPLARLSKSEVIRLGANMPLELTLSCVRPRGGIHCNQCSKCAERHDAFVAAGIKDPTCYVA